MKISKLIKALREIKKENGNLEVYLSSDSEGNSFSTTDYEHGFYWDKEKVVIYPFKENIDLTFK